MTVIAFPFERRRLRPARKGVSQGEVVIYPGVRIDRQEPAVPAVERSPAPPVAPARLADAPTERRI